MAFFADFLAGAAESASGEITRRQAEQSKIEAEQRQQDLAIERERVVAKMRADMAEQAATAKSQRTAEQMTAVNAAAPAISAERQLGEAQSRAPSLTADTLDVVKQRLSPAEMQKYYGVQDNVLTRIGDMQTAARRGGHYEAEALLEKAHKDTVDALKIEQGDEKNRIADKKVDQTAATAAAGQAAMLERLAIQGQNQLAAINARGARGEGSADEVKLINAYSSLTGRMTQRLAEIREENPAAMGAKLTAIVDSDPQLTELKSVMADVKSRLPGAKVQPSAPAPVAAPAPAGKTSAPMRYKPGETRKVGKSQVTMVSE